ncbi:MAG: hypothetical protein NVSMB2_19600 [Chloroflexota bacterium]
MVSQGRRAQWRPCRLEPQPLKDVADWIDRYRAAWEERLDNLETYLRDLQARTHSPDEQLPERNDS